MEPVARPAAETGRRPSKWLIEPNDKTLGLRQFQFADWKLLARSIRIEKRTTKWPPVGERDDGGAGATVAFGLRKRARSLPS